MKYTAYFFSFFCLLQCSNVSAGAVFKLFEETGSVARQEERLNKERFAIEEERHEALSKSLRESEDVRLKGEQRRRVENLRNLESSEQKRIISERSMLEQNSQIKAPTYENTHQKGTVGDYITAQRMTGMGYKKLGSKITTLHGIDGVYLKKNIDGSIKELITVENKTNTSHLNPGPPRQMSDEWIQQRIEKMLSSSDEEVRQTGVLLKTNPDKIEKQLWQHDLSSGSTKVTLIDKDGYVSDNKYNWNDDLTKNTMDRLCNTGKLICDNSE